jgi:outer membrane cobalamin receptor
MSAKIMFVFALLIPIGSPLLLAEELSIQVLDPSEAAVPGAAVEIRSFIQSGQTISITADGQGRVAVATKPPVTVQVKAPGFEPLTQKIETAPSGLIKLHLRPAILNTSIEVMVKEDPASEGSIERSALVIDHSGARTVYDAVDKLVPSAYVPSRGVLGHGLGTSNSISLRGLGGSPTTQLLVVIDGRPEVMGLMGHPIPDFYSLTDVGNIRITSGPASVLYGNKAMGGAIEIAPTSPAPGFHTELNIDLGSYYTGRNRLSHGGQLGRLYYQIAGGIEHTNGHRLNSSFRNQDGSLHLFYDLTPTWKASMDGRYGHFNIEDPGTISAPTPGRWSRVGRGGYSLNLDNRGERSWGSIRYFSSYGHHMIYDGFRSIDNNKGFRIQETFAPASNLELDLGGDLAQYGGRANNIKSGYSYGDHQVSEGGPFARARWTIAGRLKLNVGFRYERNSVFGGVTATEFGAAYRIANGYSLSLAIAKGFRNPTIRELYLFPAPTPTLQPEHLWNYQATFQARPASSFLTWITGYYSDASNLIVTTGRYPNLKLENIGRMSNRGLEVSARWNVTRRIHLSSGYAFLSSTNLAPYVPENKFNYSLDIDLIHAFVSFGGNAVGRTWANTARTVRLDSYAAATFKCTVPMGKHWTVFGTIDNLFDGKYEEIEGYPMPGINASGGIKIKL